MRQLQWWLGCWINMYTVTLAYQNRYIQTRGAQFQSQLMSDLCRLWGVNQSMTTLYHPQGNGVVERNNRMLGDALWSLLLERSQKE